MLSECRGEKAVTDTQPMAVICAGAKSILDIPRTLEVLVSPDFPPNMPRLGQLLTDQETQGVCVATYGDKPDFPAFYTPSSGQKVRDLLHPSPS